MKTRTDKFGQELTSLEIFLHQLELKSTEKNITGLDNN